MYIYDKQKYTVKPYTRLSTSVRFVTKLFADKYILYTI